MSTNKPLRINFFKSYTEEARELLNLFENKLISFFKDEFNIDAILEIHDSAGLSPKEGNSPFKVIEAAFRNEIVIIDASIEELPNKKLGVNYDCITPIVSSLDNIILVSRTQLPLNFIAGRTNVAGIGEPDKLNNNNRTQGYCKKYSNEQILTWLKTEFKNMHKYGNLIRDEALKIDLRQPVNQILKKEFEVMEKCLENLKKEKAEGKKIFVSYRTKYCPSYFYTSPANGEEVCSLEKVNIVTNRPVYFDTVNGTKPYLVNLADGTKTTFNIDFHGTESALFEDFTIALSEPLTAHGKYQIIMPANTFKTEEEELFPETIINVSISDNTSSEIKDIESLIQEKEQTKYKGKYSIREVVERIKQYHETTQHDSSEWEAPFYYPKGVLSNEFMPEIRRWGFVSLPDRKIRECKEFWIFNTLHYPKDNNGNNGEVSYWDSWWCLGEFLTIIRMKSNNQLPEDFKVMLFNPDEEDENKQIIEFTRDKIPTLTAEQNRELARYFANGDFLEAGLESMSGMRRLRFFPKFIRRMIYNFSMNFLWTQLAQRGEFAGMTFAQYEESVHSHVYDKSFTEDRILVCPMCETQSKSMDEIIKNPNLVWEFLNINNYYSSKGLHGLKHNNNVLILSEKELKKYKQADDTYKVTCLHGHTITIKKSDDVFYLYWTPRRGKYTGPNKCVIEKVDLYYVL